jgi:glyoxylate/hydroxypyruvate reductase A
MALALISKLEDAELWRREMTAAIPGLDFRVWPDIGDERQVRMAAFDFNLVPPGIFQRMPDLGCIVYLGHGANDFLQRPDLPKGVPVMRLKDPGIIGYMVEYVLLYLLSHRRLQATYQRQQAEHRWHGHIPPFPGDVRVAVLGLGSIGQRFARAFVSLGYQVHGWARGPHDLPGVVCFHGRDQLGACLGPCDYVVCVLPETSETRGIINADTLALMKRSLFHQRRARGRLVDDADLMAALDSCLHLSGAALDVFRLEPLPPEESAMEPSEVVVTPHAGGTPQGSLAHIAENYRRLVAGQPLINIADPRRGY